MLCIKHLAPCLALREPGTPSQLTGLLCGMREEAPASQSARDLCTGVLPFWGSVALMKMQTFLDQMLSARVLNLCP